jgi:CBS domain containing-hemolysin-like protein
LIDNVLEASETDISRIMTPGPRILFLDAGLPVPEIIEKFRIYRHPRIPVYQGHWDNVIGFLHSEDVLKLMRSGVDLSSVTLDIIMKPAHFVPPTKKVDEMFDYFQRHNTRVAIILGEYGEVLGIVTMKDVLTFIFGEISGKMEGQEYYQEKDENSYVVPGDMRLTDFYNLTNFDIEDPMMATIGGVAFRLFDRLPAVGDKVVYEGYEFTTLEVKGLRISQVQVRRLSVDSGEKEEAAPEIDQSTTNPDEEAGKPQKDVSEQAVSDESDGKVAQEQAKQGEKGNGMAD